MKVNFFSYVPFCAMKKSRFSGLDLACVETFKAPIEKFNTHDDLDKWAQEKLEPKLELSQYANKSTAETKERIERLQGWQSYLNGVNAARALFVFDNITREIKPDNREQPLIFNEDVFSKTVNELDNGARFKKAYETNLRKWAMDGSEWIKLSSGDAQAVQKLKVLSPRCWCTKTQENADAYLSESEMYIYLENAKPKVAISTNASKIEEIQGLKNDSRIPFEYAQIVEDFIKENGLKDNAGGVFQTELNMAKQDAVKFKEFKEYCAGKDVDAILNKCGIEVSYKDGKRILSHYKQPDPAFLWTELGINENDLVKDVAEITGDAYFGDSSATDLSKLERVGGYASFTNSRVKDISSLKSIGGIAFFEDSQITDVSNLKYVGSNVFLKGSRLTPEQFEYVKINGKINLD